MPSARAMARGATTSARPRARLNWPKRRAVERGEAMGGVEGRRCNGGGFVAVSRGAQAAPVLSLRPTLIRRPSLPAWPPSCSPPRSGWSTSGPASCGSSTPSPGAGGSRSRAGSRSPTCSATCCPRCPTASARWRRPAPSGSWTARGTCGCSRWRGWWRSTAWSGWPRRRVRRARRRAAGTGPSPACSGSTCPATRSTTCWSGTCWPRSRAAWGRASCCSGSP